MRDFVEGAPSYSRLPLTYKIGGRQIDAHSKVMRVEAGSGAKQKVSSVDDEEDRETCGCRGITYCDCFFWGGEIGAL